MAHLCPKCNTLYHTDEEWAIHSGGNCYAHSVEDSPSLPDFYKLGWQEVKDVVHNLNKKEARPELKVMADRLRELIDEFESAQSYHDMRRIRREILQYLHEIREQP